MLPSDEERIRLAAHLGIQKQQVHGLYYYTNDELRQMAIRKIERRLDDEEAVRRFMELRVFDERILRHKIYPMWCVRELADILQKEYDELLSREDEMKVDIKGWHDFEVQSEELERLLGYAKRRMELEEEEKEQE